jgi:hypothetical protein
MSDLGKYLPLSSRSRRDESGVSNDWSRFVGPLALSLAELLESRPTVVDEPSLRPSITIGVLLSEAVEYLETPKLRRAGLRAAIALGARPATPVELPPSELERRLRSIAIGSLAPSTRRGIGDLSSLVVASFDIAAATGERLLVDPVASGAVAIARSLTAPVEIRAVLGRRSLEAVDASWKVGRGDVLEGSAAAIVLFLFGRSGLPAS